MNAVTCIGKRLAEKIRVNLASETKRSRNLRGCDIVYGTRKFARAGLYGEPCTSSMIVLWVIVVRSGSTSP